MRTLLASTGSDIASEDFLPEEAAVVEKPIPNGDYFAPKMMVIIEAAGEGNPAWELPGS